MKVIKYWKVQLLQLSQPSSKLPSITNARNLVESLLFEGYSKGKPKINLGTGQSVELFTAPDSLETKVIRDHFIDSVRYIPVYEDDIDKSGAIEITIHLEPQVQKCRAVMGDCHVTDVNKARSSSFEDVVKPVIKWLNENANPHASVTVDCTNAQLLTGEIGIHTEEFIKD
ncbi:TPA: hypothetical protein OUF52_003861 [Klebsiella quasipneumoniae]|nr:hypothetical protein [Klebsiella quasipneumoniae]